MSAKATASVWENSKTKGFNRLVLLALADGVGANHEGTIKIETLVQMVHANKDRVFKSVGYLMSEGEILNAELDGELIHFRFFEGFGKGTVEDMKRELGYTK